MNYVKKLKNIVVAIKRYFINPLGAEYHGFTHG